MSDKKKNNSKAEVLLQKVQRKLKSFAPVAISTIFAWAPVNIAQSSTDSGNGFLVNKVQKMGDDDKEESSFRLTVADFDNPNAYKDAIAEISIKTEAGGNNPAAVATGNGYYGQHQFGGTAASGYMVRKYIAYALANGSPEFKEALAKSLLVGTKENKDKTIDLFIKSLDSYEEKGIPEKAYMPSNLAYKRLFSIMKISTPDMKISTSDFSKVHKEFPEEGKNNQSMFVYEVYLNLMPTSLKNIIKNYPKIKFGEIHPAVMGSIIAIAVKQGNGVKLNKALSQTYYNELQKLTNQKWQKDTTKIASETPLAVVYKKGNIDKDDAVLVAKNLRIYDPSGKISASDIITDNNILVSVIKSERPQNLKGKREVVTYNIKETPIEIGRAVNNREWLKNYCSGFLKVYNEAEKNLDKIPTLDTYMEMSIILNDPNLYHIFENLDQNKKQEKQGGILALHTLSKEEKNQQAEENIAGKQLMQQIINSRSSRNS